jgi:glyceraldehyde 3-phosphate dehydrogenase
MARQVGVFRYFLVMPIRFAINGVGRIGRALIRVAHQRPDLELVAINDLASADQIAPLLAHDSLHGAFAGEVRSNGDGIEIDGHIVRMFREPRPAEIPWLDLAPAVVVDATGLAKTREVASALLRSPIRKVIVSANAEDLDLTLCIGINQANYRPETHHLLSGASCTTNCLAPLLAVLDQTFGLEHAIFNTVHSYNNDQRLLSFPHKDPRRARAAAMNMIPTTTSASQAITRILPALAGRVDGFAVRVPTPNVSLIDLVATLRAKPSVEAINQAYTNAASEFLHGVLRVTHEELVSSDYLGDPHSTIVDLPLTNEVGRRLYRVVAWYDNEWGHASRLADLLELVGGSSR